MRKRHGLIILSILLFLAVLLLVSQASAHGDGDDYPWELRRAAKDAIKGEYWSFYNRECTSFVAWCLNSRNGVNFNNSYLGYRYWGHAKNWANAARSVGLTVDRNPTVGSVYWSGAGRYGHVAWVYQVSESHVWVQEYNYNGDGTYSTREFDLTALPYVQFIHFDTDFTPTITQYDSNMAGTWFVRSAAFNNRKQGFLSTNGDSVSAADYEINQRFTLNMVQTAIAENGYVFVPGAVNSGKVMNVYADHIEDGSLVNLYRNVDNSTQWWLLEAVGPRYVIHSKNNPCLVLTVEGNAVVMRPYSGGMNQLWEFLPGDQDPMALREYEICYYSRFEPVYSAEYNREHNLVKVDRKSMFEDYIILDVMPEMPGRYFMGWSRDYNATEPDPKYASGAIYDRNEPLTLYAVWKDGSEVAERSIVMALDVSGSMQGTPITETKDAAVRFIRNTFGEKVEIGLVTFSYSADVKAAFGTGRSDLTDVVNRLSAGGGTNIGDALMKANEMLQSSDRRKIIVLMSDGYPESGMGPDQLVELAEEIKQSGVTIYTLGFYQEIDNKADCQALMEKIASEGCHYEVDSAFNLRFFFSDVAEQMIGVRFIYIRIACPVEVTVTRNGETLTSVPGYRNLRTSFGSMSLEEDPEENGEIKVLRLKEGEDYNIEIYGTDEGTMEYTVALMDRNGEYTDFHRFDSIPVTTRTLIQSVAKADTQTTLNVDWDGDGQTDTVYGTTNNSGTIGIGRKDIILAGILAVLTIGLIVFFRVRKPVKTVHKSTPKRIY
ncbi:MAG: VWA domain-containing protein [Clostridiales bacterium]|nr:VWA domain-containing protein [Clostridiales bacterium]